MKDDRVLCIERSQMPTEWIMDKGALAVDTNELNKRLSNVEMKWVSRAIAENQNDPKQLIPYAIIITKDRRIACYPRHGSETRVHGLWSIGVGGHIDYADKSCDSQWESTIMTSLMRELSEELHSECSLQPQFAGIINEEITKVGHTHWGLVFLIFVDDSSMISAQTELHGLQWLTKQQLVDGPYKLELWSKLALSFVPF